MTNSGDWIGRQESRRDPMSPWPAAAMIATLGLDRPEPAPGDPLPPFWHWLHFLEAAPRARLGRDGHPAPGGFMPKVAQPRRMWAGGRLSFAAPLLLGREAVRISTIEEVAAKQGRAGSLTFVTVAHEIASGGAVTVTERQDIVYREDPGPGAAAAAPPEAPLGAEAQRSWRLDSTVLFRYSALTFNGHRIHYDADYAREVEGYPGLVVHGPLLATLLLELVREMTDRPVAAFDFRATAPVFADEIFETCGRAKEGGLALWVRGLDGRQAMLARATLG